VFGGGQSYMSSLWTDDAASAVLAALHVPAGVYNVTDDVPLRRREAFDLLASALGAKSPRIPPRWVTTVTGSLGDTLGRSLRLSNAKFKSASGWSPAVPSLREGWPRLVAEISGSKEQVAGSR